MPGPERSTGHELRGPWQAWPDTGTAEQEVPAAVTDDLDTVLGSTEQLPRLPPQPRDGPPGVAVGVVPLDTAEGLQSSGRDSAGAELLPCR